MGASGRLLIKTQGAIASLDCESEEERELFADHLADTVNERTRQQFLTWRINRSTAGDLADAQAADKLRRHAVN